VRSAARSGAGRAAGLAALAGISAVALACSGESDAPRADGGEASGRTLGFVLVDFSFEQPETPPDACPHGMNLDERDLFASRLALRDPAAAAKVLPGFDFIKADWAKMPAGALDMCQDPARFPAEPHHLVEGLSVAPGFDLDGVASTEASPGANACPHADFTGPRGETGIDNRLWLALGCIKGYVRGGTIDEFAVANIREGQRTILVRLAGVDDLANDDAVELGIFSSPDPIPVDARGQMMDRASLGISADPRHRNVTRARIVDGIVEAGPFDLRLDFKGQFLAAEYALRDARIRLELRPDGTLAGLLGGYWDVEQFYDIYARQATRQGAFTVGFRCPGMYGAVHRLADAHPDPATGRCTAISTAFRLAGIPAFVIDAAPGEKTQEIALDAPHP